jgi:biopolymer transport protein ExbD
MTAIEISPAQQRKRAGVSRMIKHHLKIDMTPMVDLGFLLISFFILTTALNQPTAMNLNMPKDGPPMDLAMSNALTIIPAADNRIYYYFGKWEDAEARGNIQTATYAGNNSIRKIIINKQHELDNDANSKEKRDGLMLLIKPATKASCKNVVDVLDEATINVVKKYALLDLSPREVKWIEMNGD